jgi:hypothetical protein
MVVKSARILSASSGQRRPCFPLLRVLGINRCMISAQKQPLHAPTRLITRFPPFLCRRSRHVRPMVEAGCSTAGSCWDSSSTRPPRLTCLHAVQPRAQHRQRAAVSKAGGAAASIAPQLLSAADRDTHPPLVSMLYRPSSGNRQPMLVQQRDGAQSPLWHLMSPPEMRASVAFPPPPPRG